MSSKTSMNVWPMILRLRSGSVTPSRRRGTASVASTNSSGRFIRSRKRFRTCFASSWRSTPLSTKMQVRRSPIARWISSAATAESTPPLRPQTTLPSPTCRRMRAVASSMNDAIVQSPVQPQTSNANAAGSRRPRSVCATSGWNSRPYSAGAVSSIAATGALALVATTRNPGGARLDIVAMARPDAEVAGHSVEADAHWSSLTVHQRHARTPRCAAGATRPPSVSVISCMP